jgi:integral membrane protein
VQNPVTFLRRVGFVEAISFLLLLCVAMPLKYAAHLPIAVKIAGWIHGVLFITFCIALVRASALGQWPAKRSWMFFIAALLPFGPFVIDRRALVFEEEFRQQHPGSSKAA